MNLNEKRLVKDIKLLIKRKIELEDRFCQLTLNEYHELDFICETLQSYYSRLDYYKKYIKSS